MTSECASLTLRAFLEGGEPGPELREAVQLYADQHEALERASAALDQGWDDLVGMLRDFGGQAAILSGTHYDNWHPDEFLYGHTIGEALTWRLVNILLVVIVNGAHLLKAAHGGSDE